EDRCAADEQARDRRRDAERTLAGETDALPALRHELAEADAALAVWAATWREAVEQIGLAAEADPDAADAALDAWQRIEMSADPWRTAETRVRQMRESLAGFAQATRAALDRAGRPPTDDPPAAIAARLGRELAIARAAETRAAELARHVAAHAAAAREAADRHRAAEAALAALRAQAGVADDATLETTIADAHRRDLAAELQQSRHLSVGDRPEVDVELADAVEAVRFLEAGHPVELAGEPL
ncbi:MAG: hypothetical protein J0H99_17350, partial [Rhodospirillales bacterium]|nr:hypothetical protein [Rhodospirillales bacterium]